MSKVKKMAIICISAFAGLILLIYLFLGFVSVKPGMGGFAVTNGMIRLLISDKDYVKVGENKYLFKDESFHKIVEAEYDSYRFEKSWPEEERQPPLDEIYETSLIKACLVSKDGQEYKAATNGVWGSLFGLNGMYYSACFKPYEE